jgi:hypothetical protein
MYTADASVLTGAQHVVNHIVLYCFKPNCLIIVCYLNMKASFVQSKIVLYCSELAASIIQYSYLGTERAIF